ncbi:uncharacterized protein KD926_006093 [Aspergillus affinis]|uniref:uncharacterized protein n=1 Tax=Aspergillus affinis TaxID=1070780 RepID=UPI0022FE8C12|nr:uncharacterized protein KD926_006093 [Aspergillus affinis]KAI9042174.1 hypothetical protein KD926_006093 [Aspergillus affinis]
MASSSVASDAANPPTDQSSGSQDLVLHVLCPSLPPPNRFTFNDLTPSTTVASLKARISQSLPGQPSSETQRLIYRGKPLASDSISLGSMLDLENGSEHSMHLALPPAPTPAANDTPTLPAAAPPQTPSSIPSTPFASGSTPPNNAQATSSTLRFRGPGTPMPSHEEAHLAVRQSLETIRRRLEQQGQRVSQLPPERQGSTVTTSIHHSLGTPLRNQSPFLGMPNTSSANSDNARLRLLQLQPQVTYFEDQVSRGIAPPIDQIIQLRTQLLQLLDEQYRKPQSERDSSIEPLLTRVFNIYTRADQLRVMQATLPSSLQPISTNISGDLESSQVSRYLLSSPDGYQGIITSPGTPQSLQATIDAIRAAQASHAAFAPNHGHHQLHHHHPAEAHPNPNAAVMENAVRQAILNQRAGANNGGIGIGRSIRRLWLFVRLYFFCYMFSEPNTWTRVLFVSLAVLAALLSETGYPQQLYRMVVAPVQQHLEGLVHFAPGAETAAGTNNANQPAAAAARDGGRAGLATELRHNLRRVERSLALFIASLVPGVGERHVEVRNAAEAARNAERTREEEERRQREEEAANPAQDQHPQQQQEDDEQRNDDRDSSARAEPAQQNPTPEQPATATVASQGDENRAV